MISAVQRPQFRLLGPLGQGGTANVARVYDQQLGRTIALKHRKTDNTDKSDSFGRLIERENFLIRDLRYPGLVRIVDYQSEAPEYLSMELCPGPTLDSLCGSLPWQTAIDILSAIAIDLEYLRLVGIVHADLKPQNLFVPSDWETLRKGQLFYVKLSDFSLGRRTSEPETARAGLGTIGYMSPELVSGESSSPASDLFALGVIAYELLAGQHPFVTEDADPVRINARVREEEPRSLAEMIPGLPAALTELVEALLAKTPEMRPASGWDVCRKLREAGSNYPFEKALQPKYFTGDNALELSGSQRKRLEEFSETSTSNRRLALTVNYLKGNLAYDGNRFRIKTHLYWPARLRRDAFSQFSQLPMREKRQLIGAAVVGDIADASKLGLLSDNLRLVELNSTVSLLSQFLRPCTVKRLSLQLSKLATKTGHFSVSARLSIQAGDLKSAEEMTHQALPELLKAHRNTEALALLNQIIDFGRLTGQSELLRQPLMAAADILKETGEIERAEELYTEILDIYRERPADRLLAETYKDLGDLYKTKRKYKQGVDALKKALKTYEQLNDLLEISHTYNNLGNLHGIAQETAASLRAYRSALHIQKQLDATKDISSTLNNIGTIYGNWGNYRRANRLMLLSLEYAREAGSKIDCARVLNNLGYTAYFSGDADGAVDYLGQSLAINEQIGTKKELMFNYENLTSVMAAVGKLPDSVQYLKKGMALADDLDDRPHLAIFRIEMANVLMRMGRFADADKSLEEAALVASELDDLSLTVIRLTCLAELRLLVGDMVQAEQLALEALAFADETNNNQGRLAALCLLSRLSDDGRYYERAQRTAEEASAAREKRLAHFNRIEYLQRHGRDDDALAIAIPLMTDLETAPDDLDLARFLSIGTEVLLQSREYDIAKNYIKRAEKIAMRSSLLPELARIYFLLGQIMRTDRNFEACFSLYKKALGQYRSIAGNISDADDRDKFQTTPTLTRLAGEIKELAEFIGQKTGAGI